MSYEEESRMVRLCADAMGIKPDERTVRSVNYGYALSMLGYNPLKNDAQAMALVKVFHLFVTWHEGSNTWCVDVEAEYHRVYNADLNSAIVECVAKMRRDAAPESSK